MFLYISTVGLFSDLQAAPALLSVRVLELFGKKKNPLQAAVIFIHDGGPAACFRSSATASSVLHLSRQSRRAAGWSLSPAEGIQLSNHQSNYRPSIHGPPPSPARGTLVHQKSETFSSTFFCFISPPSTDSCLIGVPDSTLFFWGGSTSRITSTCIWVHADTHSEYLKRSSHVLVLL